MRCSRCCKLTAKHSNIVTRDCLDSQQFCVHKEQIVNVQISCSSNCQRGVGAREGRNYKLCSIDCVLKRVIHCADHLHGAAIQQELCCSKPVFVIVLVGTPKDREELTLARYLSHCLNGTLFKGAHNSSNIINCCVGY